MVKQTIDTDSSIGISGFISPLEECQENNILCMSYELPNSCPHVPRPLEGVRFPQKLIKENDIVEMQLWHKFHGNWPSRTRYSHRNATDGENPSSRKSFHVELHKGSGSGWGSGRGMLENNGEISSSTKSYLGEVHKGAGSGWGRGRGMLENNFSDSYAHTERSRNFQSGCSGNEPVCQSSSWDSRVHNEYKGSPNTSEKWTTPSFGRGIGDLRISASQQGYKCRGRAQPSAAGASGQHRDRWSRTNGTLRVLPQPMLGNIIHLRVVTL